MDEDVGSKIALVTVTLTGICFGAAKEVTAVVGSSAANQDTDNAMVANFVIAIHISQASASGDFTLNPTDDSIDNDSKAIGTAGTAEAARSVPTGTHAGSTR